VAEGRTLDTVLSAAELIKGLDTSLKTLDTDYVDVYFLHTLFPAAYEHAINEFLPALKREQAKGKLRFIGVTEMAPFDPAHTMAARAAAEGHFDVMMFAFHMLAQGARQNVLPPAIKNNIGTMIMFAVRSLFSVPGRLKQDVDALVDEGKLPAWLKDRDNPLDFLLHEHGAQSIIEACYRYARHEPGAHVTLFGTGSHAHLKPNIEAILKPPLPEADRQKLAEIFGALVGVGIDLPNRK
jgi:aryl-alcohol dehydrogenase-like predicted oxidoreductase